MVDAEHFVFVGTNPERIGDPTDLSEAARVEWVPLESVPALIDAQARDLERWNSGGAVAGALEAPLSAGVVIFFGGADHAFYPHLVARCQG